MKDKQECECLKCHRIFIFESKFFDFYDFDGKCPKCYAEDNKETISKEYLEEQEVILKEIEQMQEDLKEDL